MLSTTYSRMHNCLSNLTLDVLHVTEACGAGVRRHLGLMLPEMKRLGLSCGLLCFGSRMEPGFVQEFSGMGLDYFRAAEDGGSALGGFAAAIGLVRRVCAETRPAVLHLHAFAAGAAGRLAAPPGPVLFYSPHAFSFHRPAGLARRCAVKGMELLLRGGTCKYILVGEGEKEDAEALGIGPERIVLARNGLPADFRKGLLPISVARSRLGIGAGDVAVAIPCRLEPQKALVPAVRAIARIGGDTKFYIFGEGSLHGRLQAEIDGLGLGGRVFLAGNVPDLCKYLGAFDMGMLPSYYEGLSYALLEMLAAGLPVLARDIRANHVEASGRMVFFDGDGPVQDELERTLRLGRDCSFRLPADCQTSVQARKIVGAYGIKVS